MDVSEILAELDDHGFADTSTARKMAEVNDAYFDACSRHAWPFLQVQTTANTGAGTGVVATPSNFVRILAMYNVQGIPMPQIRPETYHRKLSATPAIAGNPRFWYMQGNNIMVWPRPAGAQAMTVLYLRKPSELLSTDVESVILIPAEHHRILVTGSLTKLYVMEDDPELASAFNGEYEQRINNMAMQYLLIPNEYPVEAPEGGAETDASGNDRPA